MIVVSTHLIIPDAELHLSFSRSSGPGGQNVNKVNSKVTLRWNVRESRSIPESVRQRFLEKYASRVTDSGEIVLSSEANRDQRRNIESCKKRLMEMIRAVLVPPKKRKKTKPSRGMKEKRLQAKKSQKEKKQHRDKVRV